MFRHPAKRRQEAPAMKPTHPITLLECNLWLSHSSADSGRGVSLSCPNLRRKDGWGRISLCFPVTLRSRPYKQTRSLMRPVNAPCSTEGRAYRLFGETHSIGSLPHNPTQAPQSGF